MLTLDHYATVEPPNHWHILNRMQYLAPEGPVRDLEEAGYAIRTLTGSLAGVALTDVSREIGVSAEMCPATTNWRAGDPRDESGQ